MADTLTVAIGVPRNSQKTLKMLKSKNLKEIPTKFTTTLTHILTRNQLPIDRRKLVHKSITTVIQNKQTLFCITTTSKLDLLHCESS